MIKSIKAIISRKKLLKYIIKVTKCNENFLFNNSKETYDEAIELINDAIGILIINEEQYVKSSIAFFYQHILLPHSYGIYMNILSGNLPSCFTELRLIIESLAKCIIADASFKNESFFRNKLNQLENYIKEREDITISDLMIFLDKKLNTSKTFISLWDKISRDWVHVTGVANRIVNHISKKSDAPPWALVMLMGYNENDIDDIKELTDGILKLRNLLNIIEKSQKLGDLNIQFL